MSRPIHDWKGISATGYDISNAYGLAMQGINTAAEAAENWIKTKSEIETGKTMNALSLATNPDELREIMGAVSKNTWADQTALANASKTIENRMFDEDIITQELEEKLIAGKHAREMAEGSLAVNRMNAGTAAMNAQTSRMTANKNIEVADYELGLNKKRNAWMDEYDSQDLNKLFSTAFIDEVAKGTLANEKTKVDIEEKKLDNISKQNEIDFIQKFRASNPDFMGKNIKDVDAYNKENAKKSSEAPKVKELMENSKEVHDYFDTISKEMYKTLLASKDPKVSQEHINSMKAQTYVWAERNGVSVKSVDDFFGQQEIALGKRIEDLYKKTGLIVEAAAGSIPSKFNGNAGKNAERILSENVPLIMAVEDNEELKALGITGQMFANAVAAIGAGVKGGRGEEYHNIVSLGLEVLSKSSPQAFSTYENYKLESGKTRRTSVRDPEGNRISREIRAIWNNSTMLSALKQMGDLVGYHHDPKKYGEIKKKKV